MIVYAVIMVLTAVAVGIMSVLIYKGKTELIHDYHQTKVADKIGYGKAFGKALGVIAFAMALSGIIALLGEAMMWVACTVLAIGFVVGLILIFCVQRKYNGGVF